MKISMDLPCKTTSGLDVFGCREFVTSKYFLLRFIHQDIICLHLPLLVTESTITQRSYVPFNLCFSCATEINNKLFSNQDAKTDSIIWLIAFWMLAYYDRNLAVFVVSRHQFQQAIK